MNLQGQSYTFFLYIYMHAKPLFAHRLQTAKMADSRSRAQYVITRAKNALTVVHSAV